MIKGMVLVAAAAVACVAHGAGIEVQDIRLGMTRHEFARAHPAGIGGGISVGGARSREGFGPPAVQFIDGRLEQFAAYFAAQDFERIRRAVLAQNRAVQCRADAQVSVCYDAEGSFVLTRSGRTTMLLLQSQRMAAEAEQAVSDLQPKGELRAWFD